MHGGICRSTKVNFNFVKTEGMHSKFLAESKRWSNWVSNVPPYPNITFFILFLTFKGPVSPIRHCGRLLLFSNNEMISDWPFAYSGFPLFLVDS